MFTAEKGGGKCVGGGCIRSRESILLQLITGTSTNAAGSEMGLLRYVLEREKPDANRLPMIQDNSRFYTLRELAFE